MWKSQGSVILNDNGSCFVYTQQQLPVCQIYRASFWYNLDTDDDNGHDDGNDDDNDDEYDDIPTYGDDDDDEYDDVLSYNTDDEVEYNDGDDNYADDDNVPTYDDDHDSEHDDVPTYDAEDDDKYDDGDGHGEVAAPVLEAVLDLLVLLLAAAVDLAVTEELPLDTLAAAARAASG